MKPKATTRPQPHNLKDVIVRCFLAGLVLSCGLTSSLFGQAPMLDYVGAGCDGPPPIIQVPGNGYGCWHPGPVCGYSCWGPGLMGGYSCWGRIVALGCPCDPRPIVPFAGAPAPGPTKDNESTSPAKEKEKEKEKDKEK
jgi:hypothetical protein